MENTKTLTEDLKIDQEKYMKRDILALKIWDQNVSNVINQVICLVIAQMQFKNLQEHVLNATRQVI